MKKQILALLGVGTLAYGSVNLSFTETQALLNVPTDFKYSYKQSNVDIQSGNNWAIRNNGGSTYSSLPIYSQTYDGQNYFYNSTTDIDGLIINQTFNGSTTSWSQVSGSNYRPNNSAQFIGSNSSTNLNRKWGVRFENNTRFNYLIALDLSDQAVNTSIGLYVNNVQYTYFSVDYSTAYHVYMPVWAYSDVEISAITTTGTRYLSAWYLVDIGENYAFTEGYDTGYENGILDGYSIGFSDGFDDGFSDGLVIAPIGVLFQSAFSAIASIFNISVLGNLTLGSIIIAPIAVALLWFILGIVSGVGVGGKKK
jgi:hypothetical protein